MVPDTVPDAADQVPVRVAPSVVVVGKVIWPPSQTSSKEKSMMGFQMA